MGALEQTLVHFGGTTPQGGEGSIFAALPGNARILVIPPFCPSISTGALDDR